MNHIKVNALVRVSTNNELDFNEWIDYHLAVGFDYIYVYDTGCHSWLPNICAKHSDRVVFVPMANNDWRKKSNIIAAYVSQSVEPTWAICMEDDEFIWIDLNVSTSINAFINRYVTNNAEAMSVYVKYLSSEHPMKNRVGTLIDCFQHSRPDPQGMVHPCSHTPNFSLTFFYVKDNTVKPMVGPLTPRTTAWRDSKGNQLNEKVLGAYFVSSTYAPTMYPVRAYKYGLKSGIEMGMKPGTCPTGYTVRDNSMLNERAALLSIPVNEATETLFAKDEVLVEKADLPKRELSQDELDELEVPVPLGKIDTFILYGYPLDHLIDYAIKNGYDDTPEHRAVIERIYKRECGMVIESSPVYKRLVELDKEGGHTDDMICAELKISYPALLKMRKCVSVLNIDSYEEEKTNLANAQNVVETEKAKVIAGENDITVLAQKFTDTVSVQPISVEDAELFDAKIEERRKKRRESAKKRASKKKAAENKEPSAEVSEPADSSTTTDHAITPVENANESSSIGDDINMDIDIGTNLLDSIDLKAFGNI